MSQLHLTSDSGGFPERSGEISRRRPGIRPIRWGKWGALLAALGLKVSSNVTFVFAVSPFGPVGPLSWTLIESSVAVAEVGLHVRQAPNHGRLGTAGFVATFAGTACFILATVIWLLVLDGDLIVIVGFP